MCVAVCCTHNPHTAIQLMTQIYFRKDHLYVRLYVVRLYVKVIEVCKPFSSGSDSCVYSTK